LPAVSATEYTLETVELLQDKVWAMMDPVFQKLNEELNLRPS
jgi:hypothetical protein